MYLDIETARQIIIAEFAGQSRVPTWKIIEHVETEHCKGARYLSPNEKQIVQDALTTLRSRNHANNFERGYWTFKSI